MAIINCPECNRMVSDKALACPDCAYPISTMASSTLSHPKPISSPPVTTIPSDTQVVAIIPNNNPNTNQPNILQHPTDRTERTNTIATPPTTNIIPIVSNEFVLATDNSMPPPPANVFDKQQAISNLLALRLGLQQVSQKIVQVENTNQAATQAVEEKITTLWTDVRRFKDEYIFNPHLGFGQHQGEEQVYYSKTNKFYDKMWKLLRDEFLLVRNKNTLLQGLDDIFGERLPKAVDHSKLEEKFVCNGLETLKMIANYVANIDETSSYFYDAYDGIKLDNEFGYQQARERFVANSLIIDGRVVAKQGKSSIEKRDMKGRTVIVKQNYDQAEVRAYYAIVKRHKERFIKILEPFNNILIHCLKITEQKAILLENSQLVTVQKKREYPSLASEYQNLVKNHTVIHESDFAYLDFIIYLLASNKANSIKEVLQSIGTSKKQNSLTQDIVQAAQNLQNNLLPLVKQLDQSFTKAMTLLALTLSTEQLAQLQSTYSSSDKIVQIIVEANLNAY